MDADESASKGVSFCDAGCGVGSLSLPLLSRGAKVFASDISDAMADEARERATAAGLAENAVFST